MKVYCIDLDVARPEVMEFSGDELELDLEFAGTRDPLSLADFDRKIFLNEESADYYLARYSVWMKDIKKYTYSKEQRPRVPCMLLKKHYLIQSILGDKTYTQRSYKKDWKSGQEFCFHDQTHFQHVLLDKLSQTEEGLWRYDYLLI